MTKGKELSPAKIVEQLDSNIIGQGKAKRSVAIAFRNRWRRLNVGNEQMRAEITPKNILMVGPTGVGKTEIARRLAKLANAPFVKVEATKFTEVGYVGRDVDSIIRDLADASLKMVEQQTAAKHRKTARKQAVEEIARQFDGQFGMDRDTLEESIRKGNFDTEKITLKIKPPKKNIDLNIHGMNQLPPEMLQGLTESISNMLPNQQPAPVKRTINVAEALKIIEQDKVNSLMNPEEIKAQAIEAAQQKGIVFIDEIDKIAGSERIVGSDVSRQGVQRDLLPLIEGTAVQTRIGTINTDHVLFITSGSFHYSSPSDLIPELQGRLPVRVDLAALTVEDFKAILSSTDNCLVKQYVELLATEGLSVKFAKDAVQRIAEIAHAVNERQENIGARRLHTLMERLVEDVSYNADQMAGQTFTFTKKRVDEALGHLSEDEKAARIFL